MKIKVLGGTKMERFALPTNLEDQIIAIEKLRSDFLNHYTHPVKSKIPWEEIEATCISILDNFFIKLRMGGYNLRGLPPAHDLGHMKRDCTRSFMLLQDPVIQKTITSEDMVATILSGTIHDIGMLIVERYGESSCLIRHAEAGALFAKKFINFDILDNFGKDAKDYVKAITLYSIAAHTNYDKIHMVNNYAIEPYIKIWEDKSPIWPVKLTRWIDSMDFNGFFAIFSGILALIKPREELMNGQFVQVDFDALHMYPYLPKNEEEKELYKKTAIKHMWNFTSTFNQMPFCEFDLPGIMTEYRDTISKIGLEILEDENKPNMKVMTQEELSECLCEFSMCSRDGQEKILNLVDKFNTLDPGTKRRWYEILTLAKKLMQEFESLGLFGQNHATQVAKKCLYFNKNNKTV